MFPILPDKDFKSVRFCSTPKPLPLSEIQLKKQAYDTALTALRADFDKRARALDDCEQSLKAYESEAQTGLERFLTYCGHCCLTWIGFVLLLTASAAILYYSCLILFFVSLFVFALFR